MRGFHVSLLRLTKRTDWLPLLDAPTSAPAWPQHYCLSDQELLTESCHQDQELQYRDTDKEEQLKVDQYNQIINRFTIFLNKFTKF